MKTTSSPRWGWLAALLIAALMGASEARAQTAKFTESDSAQALWESSERQLRVDLERYGQYVEKIFTRLKDEARARGSRDERRAIERLSRETLAMFADAIEGDSARAELLDVWGFSQRLMDFMKYGEGRDDFGALQPDAVNAAEQAHGAIVQLAAGFLPAETFAEVQDQLARFAEDHPFRPKGGSSLFGFESGLFSVFDFGKQTINTVARVPLMPVMAVGELAAGPGNLAQINQTAAEFTEVVRTTPERVRREVEALLVQVADQQTTLTRLLRQVEQAGESIDRALRTADKVSTGVRTTVDDFRALLPEVETTAGAVGEAADRLRALAEATEPLQQAAAGDRAGTAGLDLAQVRQTAEAIGQSADEVGKMLTIIDGWVRRGGKREPGSQRFDILEYERTALAIEAASRDLRLTLEEVTETLSTGTLARLLDETRRQADGTGRGLVDHIAKRGLQLLALAFVLGALLVLLGAWLRGRLKS